LRVQEIVSGLRFEFKDSGKEVFEIIHAAPHIKGVEGVFLKIFLAESAERFLTESLLIVSTVAAGTRIRISA
jgi:hypothetical protein